MISIVKEKIEQINVEKSSIIKKLFLLLHGESEQYESVKKAKKVAYVSFTYQHGRYEMFFYLEEENWKPTTVFHQQLCPFCESGKLVCAALSQHKDEICQIITSSNRLKLIYI